MGHVRGGHARDQIGRTGAARHEADARAIGDAGQPIGHEGGSLFVADVDVLDARVVVKRVESRKVAPTMPKMCRTRSTFRSSTTARPPVQTSIYARPPGAPPGRRHSARNRIPG